MEKKEKKSVEKVTVTKRSNVDAADGGPEKKARVVPCLCFARPTFSGFSFLMILFGCRVKFCRQEGIETEIVDANEI